MISDRHYRELRGKLTQAQRDLSAAIDPEDKSDATHRIREAKRELADEFGERPAC